MGDLTICTQLSWVDQFFKQKNLFSIMSSSTCSHARLCSGDGFSVSLPAHLLLASSKMARDTFLPELAGQDVLFPSVRGSTLLLLVEILRSGRTSNPGSMDSMGHRLKEVQEALMLLEITGSMALMRDDSSVSELKTQLKSDSSYKERSENDFSPPSLLLEKDELPRYLNPVVEVTKLKVVDHDGLSPDVDCAKIKDKDGEFSGTDLSALENELMDQVVQNDLQQECHVCNKKCKNRASLKEHLRRVHKDSKFSCKQCDSEFFLEDSLKRHLVHTHHGISLNCEYCQGTYRNKESLRSHMGMVHKNEMFLCKDCDMKFISEITLRYHVENRHSGIQFQCDVCPAKFNKKARVRIHMRNVHSGILFGCDQCSSTFNTKPNLKRHIINVHTRLDIGYKVAEQLDQDGNVK